MIAVRSSDPIGRDLTKSRAKRRLPAEAHCVLCLERDPEVLGLRPDPSVLEVHHIAGAANDPQLTVVLCLNCHQRMSARMPAYGVELDRSQKRSTAEKVVSLLRGLAVFFELLAKSLMAWAGKLAQEARS